MAEWFGSPTEVYNNLDLKSLPLNHAYVIANTTLDSLGVYMKRDECFTCPFKRVAHLKNGVQSTWQVDTGVRHTWRIFSPGTEDSVPANNGNGLLCQLRSLSLGEYGVYRLDPGRCEVTTEVRPVNPYLPLFLCIALVAFCCISYTTFKYFTRRNKILREDFIPSAILKRGNAVQHLRGLILFMIIFIESGGGGYPIFNRFGGFSYLDCLYYAYTWTFGVNLPSSVDVALGKRRSKCSVIGDILKRGLILVLLGVAIDSSVRADDSGVRIWCPLQRLGLSYIFVGIFYVMTRKKFEFKSKGTFCKVMSNVASLVWCWLITCFLIMLMIVCMVALLSFNCQVFAPSSRSIEPFSSTRLTKSCDNNFTLTANKVFLGESRGMVAANDYSMYPAGAMGLLSSVIFLLMGLKAGTVYLHHESHSDRIKLLTIWATIFGMGGILAGVVSFLAQINLWPISTQLLLATFALYSYTICYVMTEICHVFSHLVNSSGLTSLALMALHELFSRTLPNIINSDYRTHLYLTIINVFIVAIWASVGVLLAKKNVKFSM